MKKLGFGLMRLPQTNPEDWSSVDMDKTKAMIDRYMEEGFTYFDTAYVYHGGNSEKAFGFLYHYHQDAGIHGKKCGGL